MGKTCSKAEPPPEPAQPTVQVSSQDRAVLELKGARDTVRKYKKKLDVKMAGDRERARELTKQMKDAASEADRAKKKKRALVFLKRIKLHESMFSKADDQLANLEQMIADYEFSKVEIQVFEGIQAGNQALQKELSVEDAERIMDEAAEGIEYVDQIASVLSDQLSDYDNDQAAADLAALEQEWGVAPVLPDVPVTDPLPDVPVTDPVADPTENQPNLPDVPANQPVAEEQREGKLASNSL